MPKKKRPFKPADSRRRQKSLESGRKTNKHARQKTSKKERVRYDWVSERINPDSRDINLLKKAVRSLSKSVRRNVAQLRAFSEQSEITPPALEKLVRNGGTKFTTKGSYESVYGEYLRALEFMQDTTHTRKGAEKWWEEVKEEMQKASNASRPDVEERTRRYWKAFNHISEMYAYMFAIPHFATDLIDSTEEYCIDMFDEQGDMEKYIMSIADNLYDTRQKQFEKYEEWGWD